MELFAGAGCGTICFPDALFPVEGFRGIHDAPCARVLALACGEKAALVSLELVMLPPELVDMVKSIVSDRTGTKKENIWVHTTHAITTPHAPHAPMGPGGVPLPISAGDKVQLEKKKTMYAEAVCQAVAAAADAAAAVFRPALMGYGQAVSHISINRDVETPAGWWIGRNPEGKTNPSFDLLRFDDPDGNAIAAIVTGGLKPCAIDNAQMQEGQRLVSSDIPGLACRLVEEAIHGPCLFFMGAAGDQVPREQALLEEAAPDGTVKVLDFGVETGLEIVNRLGREFAEHIIPGLERISCHRTEAAVAVAETSLTWGGKGRIPLRPRKTVQFAQERDVKVDGNILTLGEIALVGLKPEVNCVTAEELAEKSPYERTILISMINGGQKYMPDARSYERITWESQNSMMMPGAAEAWVNRVVETLHEMRGEQTHE